MIKTDKQLFKQAERLHTQAEAVLFQGHLLETIQQFGSTVICGSYALNLMVRCDLDVYVRLTDDFDVPTFFRIGEALTHQFQVLKASYSNHFIRDYPGVPQGLFWGIQLAFCGQKWKLDLWGFGPARFDGHSTEFEQLQKSLFSIDRTVVLRIKDILRYEDGYQDNITAMDIYSAILTGDVRTVEQFKNLWSTRFPRQE